MNNLLSNASACFSISVSMVDLDNLPFRIWELVTSQVNHVKLQGCKNRMIWWQNCSSRHIAGPAIVGLLWKGCERRIQVFGIIVNYLRCMVYLPSLNICINGRLVGKCTLPLILGKFSQIILVISSGGRICWSPMIFFCGWNIQWSKQYRGWNTTHLCGDYK